MASAWVSSSSDDGRTRDRPGTANRDWRQTSDLSVATRESIAQFYDERYAAPPGAMRDYRLYLRLARLRSGDRLLDIGCGEGFLVDAARRQGAWSVGVEIVERALRLAQARTERVPLLAAEGEALPFADRSFDRVTCIGTLEHFTDPAAGAREVARVLRTDGLALIVVPNRRFIGWHVRRRPGTEQRDAAELLLDEREWTELLARNGLACISSNKEPWHTKPVASRAQRVLLRWARRIIPRRWTYQFALLCAPCH